MALMVTGPRSARVISGAHQRALCTRDARNATASEMLRTWRGIERPKFDATSFGHFTGTGLVDWSGALPEASRPRLRS